MRKTTNFMQKLYLFAKQVHRILVLIITGLGAAMAITGLALKYPDTAVSMAGSVNFGLVRFIHSNLSTVFAIVLLLMMCTGLVLYVVPMLQKRRARRLADKSVPVPPMQT
jgi:hypothetical protein